MWPDTIPPLAMHSDHPPTPPLQFERSVFITGEDQSQTATRPAELEELGVAVLCVSDCASSACSSSIGGGSSLEVAANQSR